MSEVPEVFSDRDREVPSPEEINLQPELEGVDICYGADPFVFKENGMWNLLLQEDLREDNLAHEGISGCTIRTAPTIEGLVQAEKVSISISEQDVNLRQGWAPESEGKNMYIAHSDGDNKTHRMYVYETEGDAHGPWKALGKLKVPEKDDSWAIDMTFAEIPFEGGKEKYAIWSGWEKPDDEFPQHIYIAKAISPTEIGERHIIARADKEWNTSVKPLIEGTQAIVLDGEFRGLTVAGNASWTGEYNTGLIKYTGKNPLDESSWIVGDEPLFPRGKGIGHGMLVEEDDKLLFVGHRKTSTKPGWSDRKVFYTYMDSADVNRRLDAIK